MRAGSLFTGIGGFDLALERAGFATSWMSEIDRNCNSVLARRWPKVENRGDITKIKAEELGAVDAIVGGFPCQDLSVAGRRAGLGASRSGLFFEFMRIADSQPEAWLIIENVPGLLSSAKGEDFAVLLGRVTGFRPQIPEERWKNSGLCVGPVRAAAWRILDARHFGVAQRRRRVFVVAGPGNGSRQLQVLFEREGGGGDTAEGREAGEGTAALPEGGLGAGRIAPTLNASATGVSRMGGPRLGQEHEYVVGPDDVSGTVRSHPRPGSNSAKNVVAVAVDVRNMRMQPGEESGTLQSKESGSYSLNYQNPVMVPEISGPVIPHGGGADENDAAEGRLVGALKSVQRVDDNDAQAGHLIAATPQGESEISPTLRTHYGKDWNDPSNPSGPLVVPKISGPGGEDISHAITHAKSGMRFDPSEQTFVIQDVRGGTRDRTDKGQGIGIREGGQSYALGAVERHGVAVPETAAPLTAGSARSDGVNPPGRRKEDDENLVVEQPLVVDNGQGDPNWERDMSFALSTEAPPAVAIAENQRMEVREMDVMPSLQTGGGKPGKGYPAVMTEEPITFEPRFARNDRGAPDASGLVPALRAESGRTGKGDAASAVLVREHSGEAEPPTAFVASERMNSFVKEREQSFTVSATPPSDTSNLQYGVRQGMIVRRLTPRECERLQGFPDDWTAIGADGKPISDSARYRMLGNAVCTSVVWWLGVRLKAVLEGKDPDVEFLDIASYIAFLNAEDVVIGVGEAYAIRTGGDFRDPSITVDDKAFLAANPMSDRQMAVGVGETVGFSTQETPKFADDLSPTLQQPSPSGGGQPNAVAFKPSHFTRDRDGAPAETTPPLTADADKGGQDPVVLADG